MIYYRVAWKSNQSTVWQWKSTKLTSLEALFGFLRSYRAIPQDHLRVFSSLFLEDLNEMLTCENNGWRSTSTTAEQFLQERGIHSIGMTRGALEHREYGAQENQGRSSISVTTMPSLNERSPEEHPLRSWNMPSLERIWEEGELDAGGDHDTPYLFTLPPSMPQTLAWARLLGKVQRGELES